MKLLFPISILILTACENLATPPHGRIEPPIYYLISQSNADSIAITWSDFDRPRLSHKSGSSLLSHQFKRVAVGITDSTGYKELYLSGSTYDPILDLYSFSFDFSLTLVSTEIDTPIIVRYYLRDSGFVEIDTTIHQYKYPYANAEIFLTNSIMVYPGHFQDIDRIGSMFYFHPTGAEGLYDHNLMTGITRYIVPYGSGDHIAADSIYVFCDINHNSIQRYNIQSDSLDLTIAVFTGFDLAGLEAYEGFLYALQGGYLHKYTYDGAKIDSRLFSTSGYHLAISNGVLYTGGIFNSIRRFNLTTMAPLSNVAAPAANLEGIKIYENQLYFSDFERRIIGTVPLQDLN